MRDEYLVDVDEDEPNEDGTYLAVVEDKGGYQYITKVDFYTAYKGHHLEYASSWDVPEGSKVISWMYNAKKSINKKEEI